ncbi:MAG: rhodanese-like domain-containing protein [Niastella sp.]|uniref:rhodanese-like domain-containing protein n=1 Tax=Niastella sp. TaxID=1869183 RepID=UPI00389A0599
MKTNLVLLIVLFASIKCAAQSTGHEPWSAKQLMEPADLAKTIANPKAHQPYIYCIGPGATIKNSIDIGPGKEKANLEKFKQELSKLPKDANIVIYCGCCPFDHCPNIRPAFTLLNDMKFTNHKLLDIPHNIKVDWKDHNYPVE